MLSVEGSVPLMQLKNPLHEYSLDTLRLSCLVCSKEPCDLVTLVRGLPDFVFRRCLDVLTLGGPKRRTYGMPGLCKNTREGRRVDRVTRRKFEIRWWNLFISSCFQRQFNGRNPFFFSRGLKNGAMGGRKKVNASGSMYEGSWKYSSRTASRLPRH